MGKGTSKSPTPQGDWDFQRAGAAGWSFREPGLADDLARLGRLVERLGFRGGLVIGVVIGLLKLIG